MERINHITLFKQAAALLLPGFLYSFNIADFKRRNCHLGHRICDAEIAEFGELLAAAARPDAVAQRVGGDRWFMVSRSNANDRVKGVLDCYRRAVPFVSGWTIKGRRGDEERTTETPLKTVLRRAVRCLYTEVASEGELAPAMAALEESNWSLPVDRPVALSQLAVKRREPWQCVDQYPKFDPACPFCGSRRFTWIDGDDCSSDGICKECGAEISIRNIV